MNDQTIDQNQTVSPTLSMEELLKESPDLIIPELGSIIEGNVISISKNKILVDLGGINTGIISGREVKDSSDTIKSLSEGDEIAACVVETENEEGLIVLSLRKASQEKTWKKFMQAYDDKDVIDVKVNEANKGGLLLEIDGIKGFIPVSQLTPLHYPRVNGADSAKILERLQRLIGEIFHVMIINIDKENGKLILSEKAAYEEQRRKALHKIKAGQKIKGRISGVVNFGIFVTFEGLEGLVHISEIAWGHVKDPSDYGKVGEEVEVLIIGLEGEKISLSMKRLTPDPWIEAAKTFKVGTIVEGEINRITQFGAFMKLNDEINGLIHLSEISSEPNEDSSKLLQVGEKVKAKIIVVDLDDHRIGLSIKALTEKEEIKSEKKKDKKENKEEKETQKDFLKDLDLSAKVEKALKDNGYDNPKKLKSATLEELIALEGVGEKTAEKIIKQIQE